MTDLEERVPDFMETWLKDKRISIFTDDADFEGVYKIEVKAEFLDKYYTVVPSEQPTMTVDFEIFAPIVDIGIRDKDLGLFD